MGHRNAKCVSVGNLLTMEGRGVKTVQLERMQMKILVVCAKGAQSMKYQAAKDRAFAQIVQQEHKLQPRAHAFYAHLELFLIMGRNVLRALLAPTPLRLAPHSVFRAIAGLLQTV